MSQPKTIVLPRGRLLLHPENMRRIYHRREVRQMAASLRANAEGEGVGNLIPLIIVPAEDKPGQYYVVDGNKRLAAGDLLGKDCPQYKCEVVAQSRAKQLLTMSVSNIRSAPDILSEALHYKRLMDLNYTRAAIVRATGVYPSRIKHALRLIELEEPIQDLMASDALHHDVRVVDALLKLPNSAMRIKVAQNAAAHGDSIKVILDACAKLLNATSGKPSKKAVAAATRTPAKPGTVPSLDIAGPLPQGKTNWPALRERAKQVCDVCVIKVGSAIAKEPEPGWQLVSHAAEKTCTTCNLRDLEVMCSQCPLVQFLKVMTS